MTTVNELTVYDQVLTQLPFTTKRSLNKLYLALDNDYCKKAAFIYHDDMIYAKNLLDNKVLYYYSEDYDMQATITLNGVSISYIIEDVNDDIVLSMTDEQEIGEMIDIDIISKYKILKNRGCEDNVPFYAKDNALALLLKTFENKFNPDNMHDCMYLYMYLYTNCVMLGYEESVVSKIFKRDALPPKKFLDDIYNMYNLLYVYINLLAL